MSNGFINFIKEHPYGIAAGVVGLYLLYSYASSSGTDASSTSDGTDDALTADEINAGNQLQLAQLQAQQQSNQISAAASVANNQTAAQLSAVQIQSNSSDNQASLSAQVAEITANLEAQTQMTQSTLAAQVANTTTAAQVAITQNNNATEYGIAALPYELAAAQLGTSQITATQLNQVISSVNADTTAISNLGNQGSGGLSYTFNAQGGFAGQVAQAPGVSNNASFLGANILAPV